MYTNPRDLSYVGELARESVAKEYDWEKIVEKIEHFYELVLGNSESVGCTDSHAITRDDSRGKL